MVTVCRSSKSEKLKKHGSRVRLVPAFTIQSLQRNTKVIPPLSTHFFDFRPVHCTSFKRFYDRRDLPVAIQPQNGGYRLIWKVCTLKLINYEYKDGKNCTYLRIIALIIEKLQKNRHLGPFYET